MPQNITPVNPDLYCAQSDIEDQWGVKNVLAWSNKGDTDLLTVDTARIDNVRRFAYDKINEKLITSIYTVPLQAATDAGLPVITVAAAKIAGYQLCDIRDGSALGKQYQAIYDEVIAWLESIAAKKTFIAAQQRANGWAGLPTGQSPLSNRRWRQNICRN